MSYTDRDKYGMYKDTAGPGPALMGADTLLGDSVVNGHGDHLGDIKEIMLDMNSGQVAYAVLAFGGVMGMGEKLFAVPWQALHLDTVGKRFVLNVDKDTLTNAPGFNKDAWPNMQDMEWANQVHAFYGVDPARTRHARTDTGTGTGTMSGVSAGASVDPRAGNQGGDTDISHIRGSNIG